MTQQLRREWDDHMSVFASAWLTAMATRGDVIRLDIAASNKLRRSIERAIAPRAGELRAMRKDYHLLEAAIATDRSVISLDESVRVLFASAAGSITALKDVVWVNPDKVGEESIDWLERNAKPERKRMLGYRR